MSAADRITAPVRPTPLAAAWARISTVVRDRTEKGRSRRQAVLALAIRVAGAGLAFVSQALIARWIGAAEFGLFAVAWVYVVICGSLSQIGFSASVIRFIAHYREKALAARLRGLVRFSFWTVFAVGAAVAALGLLLTELMAPRIGADLLGPLRLALLCVPLFALTELGRGIARAHDWIATAYAPGFLVRPVAMLALLAGLAALGMPLTAELAIWSAILGTLIGAAGQWVAIRYGLRRTSARVGARYRPRYWLLTSLPLLLVDGFYLMMAHVDVLMLNAFAPPAEVAVYFAAAKTTALLSFIFFAVSAVAAPMLARLHAAGAKGELESAVHMFIGWTFWPTLAASVALVLLAEPVLGLFGAEFRQGADLVLILAVGLLVQAAVGPIKFLLGMTGQQNAMAVVLCAAALANVGLNLALIPALGSTGAALATALSTLLGALLLLALVRRRLRIWSVIGAPRLAG